MSYVFINISVYVTLFTVVKSLNFLKNYFNSLKNKSGVVRYILSIMLINLTLFDKKKNNFYLKALLGGARPQNFKKSQWGRRHLTTKSKRPHAPPLLLCPEYNTRMY